MNQDILQIGVKRNDGIGNKLGKHHGTLPDMASTVDLNHTLGRDGINY